MGLDNRKVIMQKGQRFGRWTVIKESPRRTPSGFVYWECKCDCGTAREVIGAAVRLTFDGELEHDFLPSAVPLWIREEIDRIIGDNATK